MNATLPDGGSSLNFTNMLEYQLQRGQLSSNMRMRFFFIIFKLSEIMETEIQKIKPSSMAADFLFKELHECAYKPVLLGPNHHVKSLVGL